MIEILTAQMLIALAMEALNIFAITACMLADLVTTVICVINCGPLEELYRVHGNQDITRNLRLKMYVYSLQYVMQTTNKLLFAWLILIQFVISVLLIIIDEFILVD